MSFHLVNTIARYEMRTLLRSWFFRIFTGLAIIGLGIFNVAMNIEASGAPWIYKAMAASIPYANLIILNLGQAIVAVFLASEFLKQDKKNDSVEVIYARSMSNGQYILGKTLGILSVFLVLNIIVLTMGIGFSFLNNSGSRDILSYFMYPLLISLPTLVFILGLSFFMMVLIKNQAVTFIVLLGYIALTIFYLNQKLFYLFDYIAYNIPMMYSHISGFANLEEIIYHRLIYLLIGAGLIFLTVYRLQRLPQPPDRAFIPLITGILLILSGGFFVNKYLDSKYSSQDFKMQALALNNSYCNFPQASVKSCSINLEHGNDRISAEAKLVIMNEDSINIDTLILSLNPSLEVNQLMLNQKQLSFERKLHLVLVKMPTLLKPGEELTLTLKYAGKIDERICFLDKTGENEKDINGIEVFTIRKRYAFLQNNYVCLTSEAMWYPSTWTGYATNRPFYHTQDLIDFKLQVKTDPAFTAISQGKSLMKEKGNFIFRPEYPMPKLSLIIGNYQKHSVKVDSVEYQIYSIKSHDYFAETFKNLKDTVPELIRDLKKGFEAELDFKYPYKRFALTEVPIHFCLDKHEYSYTSDAVQPEMILSPEKGVAFTSSDFRNRRYRIEREMKRNNEEALPEEIQARMFKEFVKNNFLSTDDHYTPFRHTDWKTYTVFPLYYSFVTVLESKKWPVLPLTLEAYYNERRINRPSESGWWQDLSRDEKMNLELRGKSLSTLLKEGLPPQQDENEDDREKFGIRDIVLAKGNNLLNVLRAQFGQKEVDTLFTGFALNNHFKKLPFEELSYLFKKKLNANLDSIVDNWYRQNSLPAYAIRDLSTYKVIQGEETRYQLKFTVTNVKNTDGVITVNIEENNPNRKAENWWDDNFKADVSRKVFVPAQSSLEVGFVFTTEPRRMAIATHISENLPNNVSFNLAGFNETRNVAILDNVKPIAFISSSNNADEIIVDNEDKGFSFQQVTNQAFLKSLVSKNQKPRYKYSRLRAWNPEREWKVSLLSDFYGESIRSSYYTRGGSGERKAFWKTAIPEPANYDVYFYINKFTMGWRRNNQAADYNITVYHDGGIEKINQSSEGLDLGWYYLGTFQFSDSAKVELSNKSSGDLIFADAVKWVKVK